MNLNQRTEGPVSLESAPANMRPALAATYTGVSKSHLAKLRMRGEGPVYAKVAGCVVYRRADLDAWLQDHLVGTAA